MPPAAERPGADPAELLAVAREAVAAAAELIVSQRPAELVVQDKSSATDHVTQMDTAAEHLVRQVLARRRPSDAVVGEEEGASAGDGAVTWWLDPIDGTTNYVYDHPGYAVSLAAGVTLDDGAPDAPAQIVVPAHLLGGPVGERRRIGILAAVVADPTHGRTYEAGLGGGASCDGRRLRLDGDPTPVDRLLVATGFGYRADQRARQGRVVARLLPRIRDIRRMGAAALDLCSVAGGRVDAYFEVGLSAWDLAAGVLVAHEAGARVGSLAGGPVEAESVLAAHPARFDELRRLLLECGAAATPAPDA